MSIKGLASFWPGARVGEFLAFVTGDRAAAVQHRFNEDNVFE
jgi:hypothetical protein